jgi:hypothetical protein
MAPRLIRLLLYGALAAATVASGSLHLHRAGSSAGHWEAIEDGDVLRSAASHPDAPLHAESVELVREPPCFDCLLRQKNDALGAVSLAPTTFALAAAEAAPELEPALLRRAADRRRPRGPPTL